ncbi:hypothetical protein F4859DRAFT_254589 [Xylaria cf. heliscus]|nr:hypothetical protein F4859DRAFT_254589 [Xylaria cf. heliscus]
MYPSLIINGNLCELLWSHLASVPGNSHDAGCASAALIRVSGHPVRAIRLGSIRPSFLACRIPCYFLGKPTSAERCLELSALTPSRRIGKIAQDGQGSRDPGDRPGQPASSPHLQQAVIHYCSNSHAVKQSIKAAVCRREEMEPRDRESWAHPLAWGSLNKHPRTNHRDPGTRRRSVGTWTSKPTTLVLKEAKRVWLEGEGKSNSRARAPGRSTSHLICRTRQQDPTRPNKTRNNPEKGQHHERVHP